VTSVAIEFDAWIDAASAVVDLPIAEAHRPGVARFLALAAEMAATLEAVDLDDGELALASVFRAPAPEVSGDE
jgi:hypothetical protein